MPPIPISMDICNATLDRGMHPNKKTRDLLAEALAGVDGHGETWRLTAVFVTDELEGETIRDLFGKRGRKIRYDDLLGATQVTVVDREMLSVWVRATFTFDLPDPLVEEVEPLLDELLRCVYILLDDQSAAQPWDSERVLWLKGAFKDLSVGDHPARDRGRQ